MQFIPYLGCVWGRWDRFSARWTCRRKYNLPSEQSSWAVFGTQTFGSQTPTPSTTSLPHTPQLAVRGHRYYSLLAVRLLFGVGEAGAYPASSAVICRLVPAAGRTRAHGLLFMAGRLGCALAPFAVRPLQAATGWRGAFAILSLPGFVWAMVWVRWWKGLDVLGPVAGEQGPGGVPGRGTTGQVLRRALRGQAGVPALFLTFFCAGCAQYWYLSWGPLYLEREKGVTGPLLTLYDSLPCAVAAASTLLGGWASDALARRTGLRCARATVGAGSAVACAAFMLGSLVIRERGVCIAVLALGFGAIDFGLPNGWAACADIGGPHTGTIAALCNSGAILGATISSVLTGYISEAWGSTYALVAIGVLQVAAALGWLLVNPEVLVAADAAALDDGEALKEDGRCAAEQPMQGLCGEDG